MTRVIITATSDIYFDQRVQRIAQSLSTHGYQVNVIGRRLRKEYDGDLRNYNFQIRLVKCFINSSFLFYAEYNIRLFLILLFSKVDIIYSCDLDTLLAGTCSKIIKKKKLVFDAHEYFEESPEIIGKPFIQKSWEWICKFCLPHTNQRFTVSQSLATELGKKYKTNFALVRNLPHKKIQGSQILQKEKKIIWYQGVLNKGRGLEEMLEAMPLLKDCYFYLAGDGDILDKLKKLSEKLNISERIVFLGKLEPEQLKKENEKAWIAINLLRNESKNYYYSLANKTFDYIQSNIPCIHMNFPEYQQLLEKYPVGVSIENLSSGQIISAVQYFENTENYRKVIDACVGASDIFNWENEQKKLLEIFDEL